IGHAVQTYAESRGYGVVRDLFGHGIGKRLHEPPEVPNFGKPGQGPRLLPGMTIAIEPMVNAGTFQVKELDDDWTIVTLDGALSAHFEHTILITNGEPEILTKAR
ncbi:MAG: M24 family metallopeptidase, partial [Myxococcaceae bacterium]|nr:M24 family metallopeptidase [Myxococcaceae bacterium]